MLFLLRLRYNNEARNGRGKSSTTKTEKEKKKELHSFPSNTVVLLQNLLHTISKNMVQHFQPTIPNLTN